MANRLKLTMLALIVGLAGAPLHTALSQSGTPDIDERLEGGPNDLPEQGDTPTERVIDPLVTGPDAMTNERLNGIIEKIGTNIAYNDQNMWEFSVSDVPVRVITDEKADRMRVLVPVENANTLSSDLLQRLMQANFDSALDARYAVANGVVWATYIHPLSALNDRQFISGVGQTVNLARTFGTTFSSGALMFGGGDSQDLIARELIEELLKKGGQEI